MTEKDPYDETQYCPNRWIKVDGKDVKESGHVGEKIESMDEANFYRCVKCGGKWLVDCDFDVYEVRMITKDEGDLITDIIDAACDDLNRMLKIAGSYRNDKSAIVKKLDERFWKLSELRSVLRGQMWLDLYRNGSDE